MTCFLALGSFRHIIKDARTSLFFDCWRRPIVAHITGSGMSDMNVRDGWDITIAVAYCCASACMIQHGPKMVKPYMCVAGVDELRFYAVLSTIKIKVFRNF